jgi:lysophospholipase L1-like esterase
LPPGDERGLAFVPVVVPELALRHLAVTAALGPVLLLQGRHVRRVVPRLPEPEGPREGERGEGPTLSLLVAGDSAAAGVGAGHQNEALTGRLVERLSESHRVRFRLEATTGHTTADALARLSELEEERFDVVVVSLGVNDVTGATSLARFEREQRELLALLRERLGARHVILSGLPPMHLFPALPQPLRWYLGGGARRLTQTLGRISEEHEHTELVAVDFGRDDEMMASDGFHPGPLAYARWADELARRIRARLSGDDES